MKSLFICTKHLFFFLLVVSIVACDDNGGGGNGGDGDDYSKGVLILNEGGWGQNNAALSYYNPADGEWVVDVFDGHLGELAQDMLLYGSKLYISVSGSNLISVVDKERLTEIGQIAIRKTNDDPLSPRYLEAIDGKIYVTCHQASNEAATRDGYVLRIDTTSCAIEAEVLVGADPEGIAGYNGKLYVANSGGSLYPNYANTLSIVDIRTFTEDEKVTVGLNPYRVKSDQEGTIYLTYQGNYTEDVPGGFQKIDTETKEVTDIAAYPKQNFVISDHLIYFYDVTYTTSTSSQQGIGVYNRQTGEFNDEPFISDDTAIEGTPYGIGVHPYTKEVYLGTTNFVERGKVLIFNPNGEKTGELTVGIGPNKVLFY